MLLPKLDELALTELLRERNLNIFKALGIVKSLFSNHSKCTTNTRKILLEFFTNKKRVVYPECNSNDNRLRVHVLSWEARGSSAECSPQFPPPPEEAFTTANLVDLPRPCWSGFTSTNRRRGTCVWACASLCRFKDT